MTRLARIIVTALSVMACSVSLAGASPQALDKLHYGANTFPIWQLPMSQLWLREGEPPTRGKIQPPKFQANSPNNWKGYEAEWEVRNSRLYLRTISGMVDGKKLKNESLLPAVKFPAEATWYTGRIQIAVGDFLEETQEFAAAITFEIEKGEVKALTFLPLAKINFSLDGMPEAEVPSAADKPRDPVSVNYRDIPGRAQIIGKLGQPLGKLVTVRGRWADPPSDKPGLPIFIVHQLNGRALAKQVEFAEVEPVDRVHTEFAKRTVGQEWELRGVEVGGFVGFSDEVWAETGKPPVAHPPRGFLTRLCYVKVAEK